MRTAQGLPCLHLLDEDPDFAKRLAAGLLRLARGQYRCQVSRDPFRLAQQLRPKVHRPLLLVSPKFHAQDKLPLPLSEARLLKRSLLPDQGDFFPGRSLPAFHQELLAAFEEGRGLAGFRRPVLLLHGFDRRARRAWLRGLFSRTAAQNQALYYLPGLPSYQQSLPLQHEPGPGLSRLLLELKAGNELSPDALGPYFIPQGPCAYSLRTAGDADDLLAAGLLCQKRLLLLFRAFIRRRSAPSLGVFEVDALPLHQLVLLLPLLDFFVSDVPKGSSYAAKEARRALARLLAGLPPSVQFLEITAEPSP